MWVNLLVVLHDQGMKHTEHVSGASVTVHYLYAIVKWSMFRHIIICKSKAIATYSLSTIQSYEKNIGNSSGKPTSALMVPLLDCLETLLQMRLSPPSQISPFFAYSACR